MCGGGRSGGGRGRRAEVTVKLSIHGHSTMTVQAGVGAGRLRDLIRLARDKVIRGSTGENVSLLSNITVLVVGSSLGLGNFIIS